VVLTGATGFLGQQILSLLLERHPQARLVLLLRAAAGEADAELAQWWTDIQPLSADERIALVEQTDGAPRTTPAGPRRRRRRRRRAPPV